MTTANTCACGQAAHDRETIEAIIALARRWRTSYGPEQRCRRAVLVLLADRGYISPSEAVDE